MPRNNRETVATARDQDYHNDVAAGPGHNFITSLASADTFLRHLHGTPIRVKDAFNKSQ
jgi:hypothetical protein